MTVSVGSRFTPVLKATLLNVSLQVSAFSTWEKELHKVVFDPRYLLLNSEERKQVTGGKAWGQPGRTAGGQIPVVRGKV